MKPMGRAFFSVAENRPGAPENAAKGGKCRGKPKKMGVFRVTGLHFSGNEDILSRHRIIHQSFL
jgi:hypothetical protein